MAFKERAFFTLASFAFIFYAIFASGCGPSQKTEAKPSITVWHWMTDRDPAFKELASNYEKLTGIKVNFELYAPSDIYSQKVRAAAQGANLPDIFGILGEKRDFASFVKAGYVLDLTPYMEADNASWKNAFFPMALAVNEFTQGNSYGVSPGYYGVPIDIMTIQMIYNKDLFKQLGLNPDRPPRTFSELLEVGKKISSANRGGEAANIQGLVSGWGETWMVDCLATNYAFNIMGREKFIATIKGEVPYTDPDWIRVFAVFKEMQDSGVLSRGLVTMINKTAEQLFANDKAVFAFNGSWGVNVYRGMNPKLNYGVMLPPEVSGKYPMAIWGGAGSSFMINAHAKNKIEAVKFLEWLTDSGQQAYLAQATNNLPANKDCLSRLPGQLAQFSKGMDNATHPNVWEVSEFSTVIDARDKGIQSIIIGEKTPEQVAREVQKVKERELAKRK